MSTIRSQRLAISSHSVARLLGEWERDGPGYVDLADKLRALVMDGRIARGAWLPSERELATALGKSRTMVIAAYRRLRELGYVTSVRGAGSLIELPDDASPPASSKRIDDAIDLSRAAPQMWQAMPDVIREAADGFSSDPGEPFDLVGRPALRQSIAEYYSERGLATRPTQIMVTLGAQHAITLLARTLLGRGDRVLVETPSYPHAIHALRSEGSRIDALTAVPVDRAGWDLTRFDNALQAARPSLAYLIPDLHNPTGMSMSAETRDHVTEQAARFGTILIADETTAELAHSQDSPSPLPLACYCRDERLVVTVGSLSKSVWGGMRIGWIRAHESMIDQLALTRQHVDLGTPAFEQSVAVRVLARLPEALADRRRELSQARDLVERFIHSRLPGWEIESPPGSVSMWVSLGVPLSSELAEAGRGIGLTLTPGSSFGVDGGFERHLRIPITEPTTVLERALELLDDAWSASTRRPPIAKRRVPSFV
jgi:DNA-binding transcriptional MocR family regulator